jgi:hypothetical protein
MQKITLKYSSDTPDREVVSMLDNIELIEIDPILDQLRVYRKDGMITFIPMKQTIHISVK